MKLLVNRVLKGIIEPKKDEIKDSVGNYILKSLMICKYH